MAKKILEERTAKFLGVKEMAKEIGIHDFTLRQHVVKGHFPSTCVFRIGRNYKFNAEETLKFVSEGGLDGETANDYTKAE